MKKTDLMKGLTGIILFFALASFAYAQDKPTANPDEDAFTVEIVSGEVSGITPTTISLIYDRDYDTGTEYEILVPYDEKVTLKHKTKLSEIKKGDLISIEYEKPAQGSKKVAKARMITFIQSGVSSLATPATPAADPAATGGTGQ